MEERKDIYKQAVNTLADGAMTTLILVSRPENTPLKEAERASGELAELGVSNQILVINGVMREFDDSVSESLYNKQQTAHWENILQVMFLKAARPVRKPSRKSIRVPSG